jgi:hypothetical protein
MKENMHNCILVFSMDKAIKRFNACINIYYLLLQTEDVKTRGMVHALEYL